MITTTELNSLATEDLIRMSKRKKSKSKSTTWLLYLFLGFVGGHRYYLGDIKKGILMTLTIGGCYIWWLTDIFQVNKMVSQKNRALELQYEKVHYILQSRNINNQLINWETPESNLTNLLTTITKLFQSKLKTDKNTTKKTLEEFIEKPTTQLSKVHQESLIRYRLEKIDALEGYDFEEFLKELLIDRGYKATVTPKSGDYGADLIVFDANNKKIIVQAKRYNTNVDPSAIQEVYSAKNFYHADECWVITNNFFTKQAHELANVNNVILIDRTILTKWLLEFNSVSQYI